MMPTSLSFKQATFAQNVAKLIQKIAEQGYFCTFGETFRTKEQAEIYFKQKKGILNSLHCKRLAIDLNLFDRKMNYLTDSESHRPFGEYWESLHVMNRWGGNFNRVRDGNHYEMREE